MEIIGIVAEYNPFHNGHLYQIQKIKEKYPDSILVAVVSSTFTQRGTVSILNKWTKTKIALDNHIDIVIELPFVYATQSSDIFAKGAVALLNKLKVTRIIFGTERDNLNELSLSADIQLNNKEYHKLVKLYLSKGLNYPTATNKALEDLTGQVVTTPNDLLALSYIKEIKSNNYQIKYENIKRTSSYHGTEINNNITSASNIRKLYQENKDIENLIPYSKEQLYKVDMNKFLPLLKYQIFLNQDNLNKYQTVDEGIEGRIIKYITKSSTYEELINNIKTKRYTSTRIQRILLYALLGITKKDMKDSTKNIPYIRVLGFNNKGKELLSVISNSNKNIDVITSVKKYLDYGNPSKYSKRMLNIDINATNTYTVGYAKDSWANLDYTHNMVIF